MHVNPFLHRRGFLQSSALALGAFANTSLFAEEKKRTLLMIAGTQSHGPGEHEFNAGTLILKKALSNVEGLELRVNLNGWPKDESLLEGIDALFVYCDGGSGHPLIQRNRLDLIGKLMKKGVGLMCAHFGVEVPKDKGGKEFQEWIGGYYEHQFSVNPMWVPEFKEFPEHPITQGVKPFAVRDEWYFNMRFRPEMKGIIPILSAKPSDKVRNGPYVYPQGPYEHIQKEKGRIEHMMWAVEREDGGRGVGFTGGHFHQNWGDENFRKVVANALLWISKVDVPKNGVEVLVQAEELKENLDPKPKRK